MKKYITELVGTFLFVLSIALVVLSGSPMAPLVIGSVLMVIVYMGGHVSGGHYNPAVSFAVLIRGKMSAVDFPIYVICQCLGATAGAALAFQLKGKACDIAPGQGVLAWQALVVEVVYTFLLALTVLNVATAKKTAGNSFYGLAIGFSIVVAAFSGGAISGGAFNPSIGTGLTVISVLQGGGSWQYLWIYWAGPMAGGALAAVVFLMQEAGE